MKQPDKHQRRYRDLGFTLIELVIVVVILGILSGIAVFAVASFNGTSVQSACRSDYKSVEAAVETYKAQLGVYPTAGQHGIPSTATDAVPVATGNGLMAGDSADTPNLGPWLRAQPTNGQHYRIEVPLSGALNGSGTVQVYKWDGSATIPITSPSATSADCSSTS